jgi:hypothetical protein
MKLTSLLTPQMQRVKIDQIELFMKKLNWKELADFQEYAQSLDNPPETHEEDEDVPQITQDQKETQDTRLLAEHILNNYVRDKEGDTVIETKDIELLPVEFCVQVVTRFVGLTRGEQDVKKK